MNMLLCSSLILSILSCAVSIGDDYCEKSSASCISDVSKPLTTAKLTNGLAISPRKVEMLKKAVEKLISSIQPAPVSQELSEQIQDAIGNVPASVSAHLATLANIEIEVSESIGNGMVHSVADMYNFILISVAILEREEITNTDINKLKKFASTVDSNFLNGTQNFVKEVRMSMMKVFDELVRNAQGGKLARLLEQEKEKLATVSRRANAVADIKIKIGYHEGQFDVAKDEIDLCNDAISDIKNIRQKLMDKIATLEQQQKDAEDSVLTHRNTQHEEYGGFWIFSWKIRDVHIDNGQRIAEDNRDRLMKRSNDAKDDLKQLDNIDWGSRKQNATERLKVEEGNVNGLQVNLKKLEEEYNEAMKQWKATVTEIERAFKDANTTDIESITRVDQLSQTITKSLKKLTRFFQKIEIASRRLANDFNEDLFMATIEAAMQLLLYGASQFDASSTTMAIDSMTNFLQIEQKQMMLGQ